MSDLQIDIDAGYFEEDEEDAVKRSPAEWRKITGRDRWPDCFTCLTCSSFINPDGTCDGHHSDLLP